MALFSLCKKLSSSRALKLVYSEFHTLRKLENFSFAKRNSAMITPKRNLFWIFKKRTKKEIRAIDKPPAPYELIYRNGIDNYFLTCQYASFFTTVTVTLLGLYTYSETWTGDIESLSPDDEMTRPHSKNEVLGIYASLVFVAAILYFNASRMPMRIYYHANRQKYLMYFYGPIPNQIKKQVLYVSDLTHLPKAGMLWKGVTYQHVSGQKIVLVEEYFRYPADLYIMLGLQKDPNVQGYEKVEDNK